MSQLSDLSGTKSRACITSPPSSWHARPYWANRVFRSISSKMIDADLLKQVAKVAMSFVLRVVERVSTGPFGGVRTYNESSLLR
jgi:hypothetical protein